MRDQQHIIFNLIVICLHFSAAFRLFDFASLKSSKQIQNNYEWLEEWFQNMPIDHFSFTDYGTFQLRYLINTDNFVTDGPIFFYTGNEGDIEAFAHNTGFIWDLAPLFNAAVVFAEHRFYGKTQPFGNDSYRSAKNLGFLSSSQALADFALLIRHLKESRLLGAKRSAVILFGGSYGGMLSAWMRIKYPHLVDGAIAASAPVFWFPETTVPEDIYDRIVTRSFVDAGCNPKTVRFAWTALENLAKTAYGRNYINTIFHIEPKSRINTSEDALILRQYIREVFETMAMVNYPYPTNFLAQLPGWPVKAACTFFNSSKRTDEEYVLSLYSITNLFYNYTGEKKTFCVNPSTCSDSAFSGLGDISGWSWQACTEMIMQLCANDLPNDFFVKDCPFTLKGSSESCEQLFGRIGYSRGLHRSRWVISNYGDHYPTATNIIFSNGFLDPWSGGGWSLVPKTEGSLVSIIIKDGAHHYDLRGSNSLDTAAVKYARNLEMKYIKKWIIEKKMRNKPK